MSILQANGAGLGGAGAPGGALASGGILGSHAINQSLRFDEGDSAYLTFTPSSNGTDNKKYTFSVWIKLAQGSGDSRTVFSSKNTGSGTGQGHNTYNFGTDDDFEIYTQNGGANPTSPRLYRDRGAWYHFCIVYDTTQTTDTDRVKVYVNGTQQADYTGTFPTLNSVMASVNTNGQEQRWGRYVSAYTHYFNGYMAEIHMVDGQALSPTDFAEEIGGVWVPKAYSGSYGTNGYKLDFSDSNYIGRDKSGSKTLVTSPSFSTFGGGDTNFTQANYDRAFDNSLTTSSCDRTGSGGIIEITPSSSVTPVSHTMINANSSGYTAASRPNSVLLQGSNDGGSNWTTIDDLTNGSGADTATTSSFSNTTSYAKLRLNISENHGGSNTRFGEYIVIASEDNGDGENIFFNYNLTASDVVLDSPTNNFATLNPLAEDDKNIKSGAVLSEGNLVTAAAGFGSGTPWGGGQSTIAIPTDKKIYCEMLCSNATGDSWFGGVSIPELNSNSTGSSNTGQIAAYNRSAMINGVETNYGASAGLGGLGVSKLAVDDILQIAVDGATGKVWFGRNGTYFKSPSTDDSGTTGDPGAGTNEIGTVTNTDGKPLFIVVGGNSATVHVNFGADSSFAGQKTSGSAEAQDANGIGDFYYAPPTDYVCLAASSLSEPTIGPNSAEQADDYFNTVLWSGDNAASRAITGIGHAPNFVWIKTRNQANEHSLFDSVRGVAKDLESNSSAAEQADNQWGYINSFDSDGFTVVKGSQSSPVLVNASGNTFVAWNWKAGTAFSNDASATSIGTIDSAGSVSQDAGFSIVTYTGNLSSSGTASVAHGLGVRPNMVISKSRNVTGGDAGDWAIWHDDLSSDNHILRFNTAAESNKSGNGDMSSLFTTTTFGTNYTSGSNVTGNNYVAYVFANVEGYLKCGSYVGNGSADGTFVYTGHAVKWLLVKNIDNAATSWWIMDTERSTFNVMNDFLFPNLSNAESASTVLFADFLSNGFKIRNGTYGETNASGNNYIYLAFAEAPFKYANAR